jgi:DNA polymerase elongation subunit (family B)
MLQQIDIASVLFLDIETVSGAKSYADLDDNFKELWKYKAPSALRKPSSELSEEDIENSYNEKAGIYSEFGKIICISVGIVVRDKNQQLSVRLKSFANDDEKIVLTEFAELLNQYYQNPDKQYICGHNIKEFDIPYICRRMVIHQIPHPRMLQLQGKKPWETKFLLDTLELWKFGDMKNYTSLKLLAGVLGFPSPKDDIDGSEVGNVYWNLGDLPRIAIYCEKDVLATIQLLLKFMYMPTLEPNQVTSVGWKQEDDV